MAITTTPTVDAEVRLTIALTTASHHYTNNHPGEPPLSAAHIDFLAKEIALILPPNAILLVSDPTPPIIQLCNKQSLPKPSKKRGIWAMIKNKWL